jgi:hypothetical protein
VVALMVGFVAVERRVPHPMLDLRPFRRPDFVGATVVALAAGAGALALTVFVPTLVERGLGAGTFVATAVLFAWSGPSVVAALGARWLPRWVSPRAQLVAGLVGVAAGQLALAGLTPASSIGRLLPGLLVVGVANGVLNAALGRQAVASVPADRAAMGSGANNTARYVGSAIGITVIPVIINHAGPSAVGVVSGWNVAALVTAAYSLLGALTVLLARERAGGPEPAPSGPTRPSRARRADRRSASISSTTTYWARATPRR